MSRLLVTGSRHWEDREAIVEMLSAARSVPLLADAVLVHGDCPTGADAICAEVWESMGGSTEAHPARWDVHGKKAGPLRNQEMVDLGADLCLAFPLPDSRGTVDCMRRAASAGIKVFTKVREIVREFELHAPEKRYSIHDPEWSSPRLICVTCGYPWPCPSSVGPES